MSATKPRFEVGERVKLNPPGIAIKTKAMITAIDLSDPDVSMYKVRGIWWYEEALKEIYP
jgi:hypothetical protein